ncbi:putative methylesterase 11, chloroplastic isoform X1 [Brassica napus]|uniref:putative methylesterase 11, chloroplastic isoform X1 n=1 Tax=Brassica napus TaxID=3708 RepID=UPI00207883D4|nr:putative methylesterase 11, chloroplastic isoform X1 [Brassica napus]
MGNLCSLFAPPKPVKKRRPIKKRQPSLSGSGSGPNTNRLNRFRSSSSNKFDDAVTQEQALAAAAILSRQQKSGGSLPFERSASQRHPVSVSKKNQLPRSSSTRSRSSTDPLLQPHQFLNQGVKLDDLETNHFILIHGGGFGAWCWYKTIALLEEDGFKVTAIDLAGCGINSFNINGIASLSQYVKPLTDILEKLPIGEKVILVGHDFGGACISYAMELFPSKISKAVFLAAAMLTNGQSTLDMFSLQAGPNDLMRKAQIFIYTNGNEHPPTAIDLDKSLIRDLLFNQSPSKDIALASVSMKSIPFAPVLEKLSLSDGNYGSVRRYYIETLEDNAIPVTLQENMINSSPPEKVYRLKGCLHQYIFTNWCFKVAPRKISLHLYFVVLVLFVFLFLSV